MIADAHELKSEPGGYAWRREIGAGATTFLTMAYIVVVNPAILSASGMPRTDVFFATCLSAAVATISRSKGSLAQSRLIALAIT